ncbi:hypothetical protein CD30_15885 [Ureibacillus massiliensis 4400831 = CIP 108448 = CCUG 49529]|uniref:Uncharacterized protein n=1 Tax=Ureibacillus massiliensis 4400831 = CIP 108448 = CCUG 49529 TaxID=1211035 RepID=A0A0A3J1X1_9BACL|nr:hypothetical protein CD30_15885 [Ureibacillus massiliensis 4400831 = CIP 108448 = CCUG 49529]
MRGRRALRTTPLIFQWCFFVSKKPSTPRTEGSIGALEKRIIIKSEKNISKVREDRRKKNKINKKNQKENVIHFTRQTKTI